MCPEEAESGWVECVDEPCGQPFSEEHPYFYTPGVEVSGERGERGLDLESKSVESELERGSCLIVERG